MFSLLQQVRQASLFSCTKLLHFVSSILTMQVSDTKERQMSDVKSRKKTSACTVYCKLCNAEIKSHDNFIRKLSLVNEGRMLFSINSVTSFIVLIK